MVSSSLPENPTAQKSEVVAEGLQASSLEPGDAANVRNGRSAGWVTPFGNARRADRGAVESDTAVTLAGGSQCVAVAALVRHGGYEGPLGLATTSYVADDESADVRASVDRLDLDLTVTDPGFDRSDHVAMERSSPAKPRRGSGWAARWRWPTAPAFRWQRSGPLCGHLRRPIGDAPTATAEDEDVNMEGFFSTASWRRQDRCHAGDLTSARRRRVSAPAGQGWPDFIDPSHHEALVDTPSRTLDPWLAGEDGMRRTYGAARATSASWRA